MSQSQFNSESEMDEIIPDDSISRGGICNQPVESQDSNISAAATSNIQKKSNTVNSGPWDQSNLVFVKDDKYESNVKYLDDLLGVFYSLLQS